MSTSLRASWLQTDNNKEKTTAKFSVHVYMYTKAIKICVYIHVSICCVTRAKFGFPDLKSVWNSTLQSWNLFALLQ